MLWIYQEREVFTGVRDPILGKIRVFLEAYKDNLGIELLKLILVVTQLRHMILAGQSAEVAHKDKQNWAASSECFL